MAISRFKSKILSTEFITPDVKHLILTTPADFDFIPGQYITLILKDKDDEVRKPYSIASIPKKGSIDICIKIIQEGKATSLIKNLKKDDTLDIIGPMGKFIFNEQSKNKDVVFISTGTGISTFRSMIPSLLKNDFKNKILLLTGYKNREDILYDSDFTNLEKTCNNFHYHKILSRENNGGYVQKLVEKHINKNSHYYLCGVGEMVVSVKNLLLEKGIPEKNIFYERYS
jgi:NAD(P)H-flavin reductase